MKKILFIFLFVIVLLVSCITKSAYPKNFQEASEELSEDLNVHYDLFCQATLLFPQDSHVRVKQSDYSGTDDCIKEIFELGYTEIYSNASGDVFFNKYSEGIPFYGIVWTNKCEYYVGIPDTKSQYLTTDKKWISYYDPVF